MATEITPPETTTTKLRQGLLNHDPSALGGPIPIRSNTFGQLPVLLRNDDNDDDDDDDAAKEGKI
jgi:hypothetical protein